MLFKRNKQRRARERSAAEAPAAEQPPADSHPPAAEQGPQADGERDWHFLIGAGVAVAILFAALILLVAGRDDGEDDRRGWPGGPERAWQERGAERGAAGRGFGSGGEARPGFGAERSGDLAERLGVDAKELEGALERYRNDVRRAHEEFTERLEELRRDLAERLGVSEQELGALGPWGPRRFGDGERRVAPPGAPGERPFPAGS